MSRECKSLYGTPQDRGLKVFIAESSFSFELDTGGNVDIARYLTVMLNFDVSSREFFDGLASSMKGVLEHAYTLPWDRLACRKSDLLAAYPAGVVNFVVRLPARKELGVHAERLVDSTLESLVAGGGHCMGVAVGLAAEPHEWGGLKQLRHFVVASPGNLGRDAVAVFKAVGSMMAPSAIMEWDDIDLYDTLGSADTPAQVVHAVWREDRQHLQFFSARDAAAAAEAKRAFICPLSSSATLRTTTMLMNAWRTHVSQSCDSVFSVTYGFFEPTQSVDIPDKSTHVIALCCATDKRP